MTEETIDQTLARLTEEYERSEEAWARAFRRSLLEHANLDRDLRNAQARIDNEALAAVSLEKHVELIHAAAAKEEINHRLVRATTLSHEKAALVHEASLRQYDLIERSALREEVGE